MRRRLRGSIAQTLLGGYAIAIVLLAATWGSGFLATRQITNHVTSIVQSDDALVSLVTERIKLMDDQETGLRGYLLTGSRTFLAPYLRAQRLLPRVGAQSTVLSGPLPGIHPLVGVMARRASAWQSWAARVLANPPADPHSPRAVAIQRHGKHLFDRYRAATATVTRRIAADRATVLKQSHRIALGMNLLSGGIFVLAILLTLLISFFTFQAVTQPLDQLGRAAEVIGAGDLHHEVTVRGDREFRRLAEQMDRMRRQLAEHAGTQESVEAALRAQAQRLSLVIETQSAIARAELDLERVFGLITDSAQRLTRAAGAVIELSEGDEMVYRATSGEAAPHRGLRLKRDGSLSGLCLRTGETLQCDDTEVDARVDRDATRRIGARSMVLVPLKHIDRTAGVLKVFSPQPCAFNDLDVETLQLLAGQIAAALVISSQFEAEQALLAERDRALAELQMANEGLESFAYSVSHDLRAPLRSLAGFSEILLEDYGGQFDARGERYLNHIRNASEEMGQLIDALLQLSRLTRAEMRRECVNVTALARDIIGSLRSNEPQRAVSVSIPDGMTDQADPRLLRVVLDNLLGNAWKFTRRQDRACIEVETIARNGVPLYVVRDNGAGFDMAYAAKLFAPFQRLHGVRDFEGTGIGLATVQRIIRRHGGRIWAEAAPGAGATFYFTLHSEEDA